MSTSLRLLVSPHDKCAQENILAHHSFGLFLFSIVLFLLSSSTHANDAESISIRTSDSSDGEERCAIYLADSKIPGFGRGVFTGQELGENETVFEATTVCYYSILFCSISLLGRWQLAM